MPSDLDKILSLANKRTDLIDAILAKLEARVNKSQSELKSVIEDFLSYFDQDAEGNIKNTLANKRRLNLLERAYTGWIKESGVPIIQELVTGVNRLQTFNTDYFSIFTGKAELNELTASTKDAIEEWLGLTNRGGLVKNGYLDTLLQDQRIKNEIRNSTYSAIVARKGFFELRKDLATYIEGNKEKTGALQRYYAGFAYDTISQVDRTQSKVMADSLKLTYAIYEGGLVKDSRPFCKQHNGKVYTSEEIAEFDPKQAKPPNYNPFTMAGGYRCRHHLNFIPESIAKTLRKDL